MQTLLYDNAKLSLWTAKLNLATDPIWAMLVDDSYTPDPSHKFVADVTGEVKAPGYLPGGQQINGQSVVIDAATHRVVLKSNKLIWKGVAMSAAGLVLYKKTADGSPPQLICCVGFGDDGASNLDFVIGNQDNSLISF